MKTTADVRRARTLLETLDNAREWRETFEDASGKEYELVEFSDIYLCESGTSGDSRTLHGYEGRLVMPREDAIEMMKWLEIHAHDELAKIGVALPIAATKETSPLDRS